MSVDVSDLVVVGFVGGAAGSCLNLATDYVKRRWGKADQELAHIRETEAAAAAWRRAEQLRSYARFGDAGWDVSRALQTRTTDADHYRTVTLEAFIAFHQAAQTTRLVADPAVWPYVERAWHLGLEAKELLDRGFAGDLDYERIDALGPEFGYAVGQATQAMAASLAGEPFADRLQTDPEAPPEGEV